MDTQEHSTQPADPRRCPTCGAELVGTSWFCGSCGSLLAAVPVGAVSDATRPIAALTPAQVTGASVPAAPQLPASADAEQRRCEWCGALNAPDAPLCTACGATFPTPEQEAALLEDVEARLRATREQEERGRQQRHGLGRFFKPS